jgi:(S)-ureidoglycine aminohydrolase
MHVNIVTFEPGAVIPFAETHVMEHGLYVLEGKAVYKLNRDWVEVEAGDFMWLRAFCPQACYAGGPGRFRYLLYKDVNRHMGGGDNGRRQEWTRCRQRCEISRPGHVRGGPRPS